MQLEDPGMRQMSMDSEDSMKRMKGVSAEDEWQDDEYARHSLQGNKEGAKKSEESDSFYRRPVPEVCGVSISLMIYDIFLVFLFPLCNIL